MQMAVRENVYIQHSWHRKPIRCHEVWMTTDDGRVILAAIYRSKVRARKLAEFDLDVLIPTERTDQFRGQPGMVQVSFHHRDDPLAISIAIDESI